MRKFVLALFNLVTSQSRPCVKFLTGISRRTRAGEHIVQSWPPVCVLDKTTSEWNITCVCVGGVKGGGVSSHWSPPSGLNRLGAGA